MALAGEGRNGEKCAGASRMGVVPLASSRERMEGGSGWGRGRASGGVASERRRYRLQNQQQQQQQRR